MKYAIIIDEGKDHRLHAVEAKVDVPGIVVRVEEVYCHPSMRVRPLGGKIEFEVEPA